MIRKVKSKYHLLRNASILLETSEELLTGLHGGTKKLGIYLIHFLYILKVMQIDPFGIDNFGGFIEARMQD